MSELHRALATAVRTGLHLVVDVGAVALGILLAVAAAWVLSRSSLLGDGDAVGCLLLGSLWAALAWSLRQAVLRHQEN